MAQFDAQRVDPHHAQFQQDQARIVFLEQNVNYFTSSIQQLHNNVIVPIPQQIPIPTSIYLSHLHFLVLLPTYQSSS